MRIRRARPEDRERLYEICLLTGDAGADATPLHDDPALLGHVYVGPYLAHQPDLAFVAEDGEPGDGAGEVVGYVLGALDVGDLSTVLEAEWWPTLRRRHPLGSGATAGDQALVRHIHRPPPPHRLVERFPSELHIDLAPSAQGRRVGRRLIDTLLGALAEAGSEGVHLGVDPRNAGALAFYERLGFERSETTDEVVVFTRTLTG